MMQNIPGVYPLRPTWELLLQSAVSGLRFFPAWVHAWCISGPGDLHCMKKFSVFFNLDIESQLGSLRFEDCVRMGYVAD
jgi:hypothetical protein